MTTISLDADMAGEIKDALQIKENVDISVEYVDKKIDESFDHAFGTEKIISHIAMPTLIFIRVEDSLLTTNVPPEFHDKIQTICQYHLDRSF